MPSPCGRVGSIRDPVLLCLFISVGPRTERLGLWGAAALVAMEQGRGPGAGIAAAALAPGSHRGGVWLGAHVWFEISATGLGLPRDLAARSRDKHWKVGRASQAHKEPSVVSGGDEGAICPEVWVRRGVWETSHGAPRPGSAGSQTAWLGCHGSWFESRFRSFLCWVSPVQASVSLSVKQSSRGGVRTGRGRDAASGVHILDCMTLDKSRHISEPQFSHLANGCSLCLHL